MPTLLDDLLYEVKKSKEQMEFFKSTNGENTLAVVFLKEAIEAAEKAISSNNSIAMLVAYTELKQNIFCRR